MSFDNSTKVLYDRCAYLQEISNHAAVWMETGTYPTHDDVIDALLDALTELHLYGQIVSDPAAVEEDPEEPCVYIDAAAEAVWAAADPGRQPDLVVITVGELADEIMTEIASKPFGTSSLTTRPTPARKFLRTCCARRTVTLRSGRRSTPGIGRPRQNKISVTGFISRTPSWMTARRILTARKSW